MAISSFVSPQQLPRTAGGGEGRTGGLLYSINAIIDTPPAHTPPYVSRFAANSTFAKEKGRVQEGWKLVKKKISLCGESFQPEKNRIFFKVQPILLQPLRRESFA